MDAVLGDGVCVDMRVDTLCGEVVLGVAVPFAVERLILLLEYVVPWVAELAFRVGRASSREAIDVRVRLMPASGRTRALLLGESERDAISGGLLDMLACLDGLREGGRGGTALECDVLLTVATEGERLRSPSEARSDGGGGGACLEGLGLVVAGRGGSALTWGSSNTEVTGDANGDMVRPRRS